VAVVCVPRGNRPQSACLHVVPLSPGARSGALMAPKWNAAAVEAYLAKFQVEEMVQQAVNSVISSRAPDPLLHVADFLEARGLEMDALAVQPPDPPVREGEPQTESEN